MTNSCNPTLSTETSAKPVVTSTLVTPPTSTGSPLQSCPSPYVVPTKAGSPCFGASLTSNNLDDCYANTIANEIANLGSASVYIYKLLGVHEQTKLIDLTGNGNPISSGDLPGFPRSHAFTTYATEWKSVQRGNDVLSSGFIGYDFGNIRLDNDRPRYGLNNNEETAIRQNIATIKIKQGLLSGQRATRIRVERSQDGIVWYGAALVDLPDTCDMAVANFNQTVPSRYWRLRPISFTGSTTNNVWAVQSIEMSDYQATKLDNIQDTFLMENRDRDYAKQPILLKAMYDVVDVSTNIAQWGITLIDQTNLVIPFSMAVQALGRPIVIGDIFEIPSEAQYDPQMNKIPKYVEATDVGWDSRGFTPGWIPTMLRVTTSPLMASQETQGVVGDLTQHLDDMGLSSVDDGSHPIMQDFGPIEQSIGANEKINVPQRGADTADYYEFTQTQIDLAAEKGVDVAKLNVRNNVYSEDALPPSGKNYTENSSFPTNPADGDYHRLIYVGTASDVPARLFRYSVAKNRWLYMETDRREQQKNTKPILQEYLSSPTKQPSRLVLNKG